MAIEVRKLGDALLAEVVGVDISKPIDAGTWGQINQAFLDHCVLAFRGQTLTPRQMLRFEENFGPAEPHITVKYRHPEVDELIVMSNLNDEGEVDPFESSRGVGWHTDMCYLKVPSKATMLHMLEIPEQGGDTLFANMYLALEDMPAALRGLLHGRRGTFRYGGNKPGSQERLDPKDRDAPLVDHPIFKPHSETGRRSLFVNPAHTVGILDMPDDEAGELLEEVYAWCGQPKYQARHQWRMDDTVIWDNRCTWHSASGDNPLRQPRRFLRGTIRDGSN